MITLFKKQYKSKKNIFKSWNYKVWYCSNTPPYIIADCSATPPPTDEAPIHEKEKAV